MQRSLNLSVQYDIETQEELAEYLNNAGFKVTQATVSRDIRDLKLTKVSVNGGKQKYVVHRQEEGMSEKYIRVLKDGYVSNGYGSEYSRHKDCLRHGYGGSGRTRRDEME